MFYDVRISQNESGKTVVTVRKVFPKKRKRNKVAGLERNYVTSTKKYIVTDKVTLHVPANGRIVEFFTIKLCKGDKLTIYHNHEFKWAYTSKSVGGRQKR